MSYEGTAALDGKRSEMKTKLLESVHISPPEMSKALSEPALGEILIFHEMRWII